MDGKPSNESTSPGRQSDGALPFADTGGISPEFRCGYVAIAGNPNVGKSTLMNALLNQKISIVTPKPQTTRHRILGILSTDTYQAIFLDTPGFLKPQYLLHKVMMESADAAIADADVLLWLLDATTSRIVGGSDDDDIFTRLESLTIPKFLALNKVDLVHKPTLLPLIEQYSTKGRFKEIIPISALRRDGTDKLLGLIIASLPKHPPLYPLDIVSDRSERFFVAEIVREKVFMLCQQEVPYSTSVVVTEFVEREGGKTLVSAEIVVERGTQRAILIGKRGGKLKEIGSSARKDIEEFLQRQVFLDLRVKVREEWRKRESWLERLGYRKHDSGPHG